MITKLTPEQEKLMYVVRDEWINLLDKPSPLDKNAAEQGICWLYQLAKLDKPEIIWCESPSSAVDSAVDSAVRLAVGSAVGLAVRLAVDSAVDSAVRSAVDSAVDSAVGLAVRLAVDSAVDSAVRLAVDSAVDSAVRSAVGIYWFSYYARADYYNRSGIITTKDINNILEFLRSGIYEVYIFKGKAFVAPTPKYVKRDEKLRLHNDTGKSIEWADNFGLYSLWGVTFDEQLWQSVTSKTISAKEVLAIKNIDQRMVAMKYLGLDNLISELKPKTVNKSKRGNELIKITEGFPTKQYALRYKCPSTGREYLSFVPPEIGEKKDADAAMSWKFGIDVKEYDSLEIET